MLELDQDGACHVVADQGALRALEKSTVPRGVKETARTARGGGRPSQYVGSVHETLIKNMGMRVGIFIDVVFLCPRHNKALYEQPPGCFERQYMPHRVDDGVNVDIPRLGSDDPGIMQIAQPVEK